MQISKIIGITKEYIVEKNDWKNVLKSKKELIKSL